MIIDGAVAFIAGGAGGFGAATARRLHAAGATVVVGDLDEDKGRAVADDLGERAVFVGTDVLSETSVTAALAHLRSLGRCGSRWSPTAAPAHNALWTARTSRPGQGFS